MHNSEDRHASRKTRAPGVLAVEATHSNDIFSGRTALCHINNIDTVQVSLQRGLDTGPERVAVHR